MPPASWWSTRPRASPGCASLGVPFSQEAGHLHLTREGGHSARRIVHVTDATGAAVQQTLIALVRNTPNITVFEQHTLVDLITSRKLGLRRWQHLPGPVCAGRRHR